MIHSFKLLLNRNRPTKKKIIQRYLQQQKTKIVPCFWNTVFSNLRTQRCTTKWRSLSVGLNKQVCKYVRMEIPCKMLRIKICATLCNFFHYYFTIRWFMRLNWNFSFLIGGTGFRLIFTHILFTAGVTQTSSFRVYLHQQEKLLRFQMFYSMFAEANIPL
jgi:hypothetical protein